MLSRSRPSLVESLNHPRSERLSVSYVEERGTLFGYEFFIKLHDAGHNTVSHLGLNIFFLVAVTYSIPLIENMGKIVGNQIKVLFISIDFRTTTGRILVR